MASRDKKSGSDFILESRHLIGLFMLLVVIFGVVFTLGYLLGRSQYDTQLRAAVGKSAGVEAPEAAPAPKAKTKPEANDAVPPPPQSGSDWDFFQAADSKTTEDHLQPPPKPVAAKQPPAAPKSASTPVSPPKSAKSPAPVDAPLIPKGTIMLQVAAVKSEGDALALAQALQQKKFPAFVIPPSKAPGADRFYRVQVGPYPDNKSATNARNDLEAKGFKSIIKR